MQYVKIESNQITLPFEVVPMSELICFFPHIPRRYSGVTLVCINSPLWCCVKDETPVKIQVHKKDLKYPEKSDNNFVTKGCSTTVKRKIRDAQNQ